MTKLECILKSRDISLPTKVHIVIVMVFPVVIYGCESWTIKKAECRRINAFELWCWKSPLDCKEIKPVNPKGNQSWKIRIDAEAKTPILWPPDAKSWLLGKDPDAGTDWRREEKGTTQDEMVGWHHRFEGHEFLQAPGVGDRQGTLACCSPWDHKKLDMTEWLNNNNRNTDQWNKIRSSEIISYINQHSCSCDDSLTEQSEKESLINMDKILILAPSSYHKPN